MATRVDETTQFWILTGSLRESENRGIKLAFRLFAYGRNADGVLVGVSLARETPSQKGEVLPWTCSFAAGSHL